MECCTINAANSLPMLHEIKPKNINSGWMFGPAFFSSTVHIPNKKVLQRGKTTYSILKYHV